MAGEEPTKFIELSRGLHALVDAADYEWLSAMRWRASKSRTKFYAVYTNGKSVVQMHRLILPPPDGLFIDHINGNSLDNRRCNLRLATRAQNNANRPRVGGGYKGVSLDRKTGKWLAFIYLGMFDSAEAAAAAYDKQAESLHGEFHFKNIDSPA